MYKLKEKTRDGNLTGCEILAGDQFVAAVLNGGLSIMVTTAHAAMADKPYGSERQDAFLFGIVTALNHCTLTGAVPTVTDGLRPSVESQD